MRLRKPTIELVEKYQRQFEDKNGAEEEAISELLKLFPDNKDYSGVLLKCVVINTLYSTQIRAIKNVARNICELDIDARLSQGDPNVVDQIAELTIGNKKRRNYSFATKYYSFHQPSLYPIYDSIVDKVLKTYQRRDRFSPRPLGNLKDYRRFKEVLEEFVNWYDLKGLGFRKLDCFLHDHGKEQLAKRN